VKGEHEAGELAARGRPPDRSGRLAGVRGEKELRPLDPCRMERDTRRVASGRRTARRGESDREARLPEGQRFQLGLHRGTEARRRVRSPLRQDPGRGDVGGSCGGTLPFRFGELGIQVVDRGELALRPHGFALRVVLRRPPLQKEPLEGGASGLDRFEARRVEVEAIAIGGQRVARVLELEARRLEARSERREQRVDATELGDAPLGGVQ
jgi:hypothetical protein